LSYISSPFCYFGDGVLQMICLGWPWTTILSSASQVIRIIGMSHNHLAHVFIWLCLEKMTLLSITVGWDWISASLTSLWSRWVIHTLSL
jgi:hypothetical protein